MESAPTADVELVSLRGHHSDEDEGPGKAQDQESTAPFKEGPRKTGHSLSIHYQNLCVAMSVPEGLAKFWNPPSKGLN